MGSQNTKNSLKGLFLLRFKYLAFLLLLLLPVVVPTAAMADGFAVLEWSAGGVAMGEAYMFAEDDASVLAYNPAGITKLKGRMISGGVSYINPRGRADFFGGAGDGETWSNSESPAYVPNFYYTSQANDRLTWGIGLYTRFGNASEFDPNFPGRFNSYKAQITSVSAVPTLAWQATPKLSLAAGVEIMYMKLDARKKLSISDASPSPEFDFQLDGDGFGYGWNFGLNYDFDEKTSFAMVYRSRVEMELKGDAIVSIPGMSTGGGGEVTLPDSLTVGLGHKFNDRTRVEVGATHTWWSTYDRLTIDFDTPIGTSSGQSTRKDWENVWRYQIGVEHKMDERWTIMFGYAYDNAPMPDDTMDFMVPTGDRQTASIGFKYHNKNATWTFGYGYMWIKDRIIPGMEDGKNFWFDSASARDNDAHILSLSYTLKLK